MSSVTAGARAARGSPPRAPGPTVTSRASRDRVRRDPGVLRGRSAVSVLTTVGIVIALALPGARVLRRGPRRRVPLRHAVGPSVRGRPFGVLPLVTATLWTTGDRAAGRRPFGLGAAIFLSRVRASRSVRKVLKPILEILAGVPTVVYGFFALQFVQTKVFCETGSSFRPGAFSVLAAGLVMGIMIIPTVASISEDAMSAVPLAMRQGSAALGANRMQTTLRVVFPAALSGIVAAVVLGISRAVGETMIVASPPATRPMVTSPLEQGQTMTGFIANAALGDSRVGIARVRHALRGRLLLFVITLASTSSASASSAASGRPTDVRHHETRERRSRLARAGRQRRASARALIFLVLLWLSAAGRRSGAWSRCSITIFLDGAARLDADLFTDTPASTPDEAGARAGHPRVDLGHRRHRGHVDPARYCGGGAPRGVRRQRKWYNRLIELNVQNLAAVPSIVYGMLALAFLACWRSATRTS